jgi:hypothetical protein
MKFTTSVWDRVTPEQNCPSLPHHRKEKPEAPLFKSTFHLDCPLDRKRFAQSVPAPTLPVRRLTCLSLGRLQLPQRQWIAVQRHPFRPLILLNPLPPSRTCMNPWKIARSRANRYRPLMCNHSLPSSRTFHLESKQSRTFLRGFPIYVVLLRCSEYMLPGISLFDVDLARCPLYGCFRLVTRNSMSIIFVPELTSTNCTLAPVCVRWPQKCDPIHPYIRLHVYAHSTEYSDNTYTGQHRSGQGRHKLWNGF